MSETGDPLYRKDLLRLAADATGAGRLPAPGASATVHNPACGDKVTVDLNLADGRITALAHDTKACVLAQASAALLADVALGMNRTTLAAMAEAVRANLTGNAPPPAPAYAVFDGAIGHATRHTCVMLPIEAALKALEGAEPGT